MLNYCFSLASEFLQNDREALLALYRLTDGANWTHNTNWGIRTDLGTWHGVSVDDQGRVLTLSLAWNNLSGTFVIILLDSVDIDRNALFHGSVTTSP